MYTFSDVEDCISTLVGFRNHTSNDYPKYDESIIATSSQRVVSHPLINVENLYLTITDFNKYNYPTWAIGDSYSFNERVYGSDGNVYKSLVAGEDTNTGNDPISSGTQWEVISGLSLYLEAVRRDSAEQVLSDVVLVKKNRMDTKSIFSKLQIYQGAGRLTDLVNKTGSLVGFQIDLKRSQNLKMVIDKIGVQFDTNQTITFYLYHSSQAEAITTFDIVYTKGGSFQWADLTDVELSYFTSSYNSGGSFFLMYDEDEIDGQAVNYSFNFSKQPCVSCNGYNLGSWNQRYKFFSLAAVKVNASNRDGVNMWDIQDTEYLYNTNFGLNLSVTLKCDIGDLICEESYLFKDILAQKVIVNLLQGMIQSTEANDKQTMLNKLAFDALNGETIAVTQFKSENYGGEFRKYEQYLEALNFDLSDLNDVCTPCTNKGGVKYRPIG